MKKITDYSLEVIHNSIQYLTEKEFASALHYAKDNEAEEIILNSMMPSSRLLYEKEMNVYDFDKSISENNYNKLIEILENSISEVEERDLQILKKSKKSDITKSKMTEEEKISYLEESKKFLEDMLN